MQQYIRIFMPLINEIKGYECKGKNPAGRCLLESRENSGKLMLWVQDLRPEVLYRVHLIFKVGKNYAGLPLCSLSPRPGGKAELRHTFNAADIEGYGLSLEQCLAVAIIAGNEAAPLCAYRGEIFPWRNGFTILVKDRKPEEPKEERHEEPEETIIEPIEETIEEVIEEKLKEPEILITATTLTESFKNEVEAILKSHTHMQPFEKQSRHVEWRRISIDEDIPFPNYICDLLSDPFVEAAYKQYNHILLGKADDDGPKRYYIGIPAQYDPKDKIIGFRQFKSSEDKEPEPGDFGYWLIFMA